MIHRDDLRYTDDVIATLQSDNPRWYIAKALSIAIEDVEYHYEEVRGVKHNGSALCIVYLEAESEWPEDPSWYVARSRKEIAAELGKTTKQVNTYIRNHAYTVKRDRMGPRPNKWPDNPLWYKTRSTSLIAETLGYSLRAVNDHMVKMGYVSRRIQERHVWPKDPQWYAERTAKQMAEELKIYISTVYEHLKRKRYAYKPTEYLHRIDWPKDTAWYADKTIREIAAELSESLNAVRAHVYRNKLPFKRMNQ
jgi:DNA-binding CsgD family transcriptional regulator